MDKNSKAAQLPRAPSEYLKRMYTDTVQPHALGMKFTIDYYGVDHLMYLERERMNAAGREGNPRIEAFCNACFTGEYPTGDVTRDMLTAIEGERCASQKQIAFWS